MKKNEFLIIYSICKYVKGYTRTAIYDIQRTQIDFIPNDMYQFCTKCNGMSLEDIKKLYVNEDHSIVSEYIDFLVSNQYGMIGSQKDTCSLPQFNWDWDYYSHITNCIYEYSVITKNKLEKVIYELNTYFNCTVLELTSNEVIKYDQLVSILNLLKQYTLTHLELIIPFSISYSTESISLLLTNYSFINKVTFYSSPIDKIINLKHTVVVYTREYKKEVCGYIEHTYFSLNIEHVTEAINYNTCLNRKLSIDKDGNIKNCPFSDKVFGSILTSDINSIVNSEDFQKVWHIKKDEIKVCKDCEFRYVCTDCRVFIKDSNDIYSQPAKCTYNPYIGKWKNEEEFCSVEESLKIIDQ